MSESPDDVTSVRERREHPRLWVQTLVPIDLGKGTTGSVLNIAEGGWRCEWPLHRQSIPDFFPPFPTANIIPGLGRNTWTDRVGE